MDMYLSVGYTCAGGWGSSQLPGSFLVVPCPGVLVYLQLGRFAAVPSLTLYSVSLEICMSFPVAS